MKTKISRRSFLAASGILAASAALTACSGSSNSTAASSVASSAASDAASTAATGDEGDLSAIIPEETVTLTCYSQLANYSGELTGWFAQVLKEKFNVKINIVPDLDGAFSTRMESGDLGDIVIIAKPENYLEAVNKGMLLDWNEDDLLAEYGPYIKNHMQAALEKNETISGGTVYGYGYDVGSSATDTSSFMYNWGCRWDLYKAMGYPEINTLDDFADMLIEMNKQNPTDASGKKAYAVSLFSDWDGVMAMFPKAMVSAYYGYDEFGIGFYNTEKQEYVPACTVDSPYVEALRFYNKLYRNGAMDPDSETQGYDGCSEDYRNGTAYFNPFGYMGTDMFNSVERVAAGQAMYPIVPKQAKTICYGQNIYGYDRVWSIGDNTEYPELCMAIINWLSTPTGKLTDLYGPKDVCWYYDDEKHTCFTELGRKCVTDGNTQMTDGYSGAFKDGQDQMNNTTWTRDAKNPETDGDDYNWAHWPSNVTAAAGDIEQDWRDKTGADSIDEYMTSLPYMLSLGSMYSASTKSDELTVIWNQVGDCVKTNSWKAMFAKDDAEFDQIINDMVATAKSYGLDQCDEFQANEAKLRAAAEDQAMADNA